MQLESCKKAFAVTKIEECDALAYCRYFVPQQAAADYATLRKVLADVSVTDVERHVPHEQCEPLSFGGGARIAGLSWRIRFVNFRCTACFFLLL